LSAEQSAAGLLLIDDGVPTPFNQMTEANSRSAGAAALRDGDSPVSPLLQINDSLRTRVVSAHACRAFV
jgi:hypothetical protein